MKNKWKQVVGLSALVLLLAGWFWFQAPPLIPSLPKQPWLPSTRSADSIDVCGASVAGDINGGNSSANDQAVTKGEDAAPVSVARQFCEHGAVKLAIFVHQSFGYRLGDVIKVTVLIDAANDVAFDFSTVRSGLLTFEGTPDFELAPIQEPVQILESRAKSGRTAYQIVMNVRSLKTVGNTLNFSLDIQYSRPDSLPRRLQTPTLSVTRSLSVDKGEELLNYDATPVPVPVPWSSILLYWLALILALPLPVVYLMRLYQERTRVRVSAEELFWNQVDAMFTKSKTSGFGQDEARKVLSGLAMIWGLRSSTAQEIFARKGGGINSDQLRIVLNSCTNLLYKSDANPISGRKLDELRAALELVLPRPWSV